MHSALMEPGRSLRLPRLSDPGVAAPIIPRQHTGGLQNRLCHFLSPNGTYDLTGK